MCVIVLKRYRTMYNVHRAWPVTIHKPKSRTLYPTLVSTLHPCVPSTSLTRLHPLPVGGRMGTESPRPATPTRYGWRSESYSWRHPNIGWVEQGMDADSTIQEGFILFLAGWKVVISILWVCHGYILACASSSLIFSSSILSSVNNLMFPSGS